jgi:hypothetical protein
MTDKERIAKLEELVGLLSTVYYNQDDQAIDKLTKELWPDAE